jgi:serine protease AprX
MAAAVVSGVAAMMLDFHPEWTPAEVKSTMLATARNIPGGVEEVNAASAMYAEAPAPVPGEQPAPNDLVDGASGAIDYTRSSWGRSSWGSAPEALVAGWARSSWGCACAESDGSDAETARSSWGTFSWASRWEY